MIRREVALTGTARPSPAPATAVLMPTILPRASASAPPELPGLRAASVWMTSSIIRRLRPDQTGMERPSPLTTPAVTEPESPSGLPTAMTNCPTLSDSASPRSAGVTVGALPCTTARSESGSEPTTSTAVRVPSAYTALPPWAPPTTWALVRRYPSEVNRTAEPAPMRKRPCRPVPDTSRAATWGVTAAATRITVAE